MEQVCFDNVGEIVAGGLTGLVTLFSLLANFISGDSVVGKAIHFLALNFTVKKV